MTEGLTRKHGIQSTKNKDMKNNKQLIVATLCFLVLGLFVCQSVYWFKAGKEISYQFEEENELLPLVAKEKSKNFKIVYNSDKTYRVANVYQRTISRSVFPFTETKDVLVDGPILKWYK